MSLLTVTVGDRKFVVDAANKSTAKAFGRSQIEVKVEDASAADVQDFIAAGNKIITVPVGGAAAAPAGAEDGEAVAAHQE